MEAISMGPENNSLTPPPTTPPPAVPPPTPPGDLPAAPVIPAPEPVAPTAVKPEVTQAPGGSSKKPMMIAIIIVLIIAILGVGGFFAFNTMQQKPAAEAEPVKTEEGTEDTSKKDIENLNSEVAQIELTDPDADLAEVDKDIAAIDASPASSASASARPIDR